MERKLTMVCASRVAGPPALVLFALPEEAKPFVTERRARPLRVAWSGAGARNAQCAARGLLLPATPFVLICGFAGGLNADCKPGDVVVADEVLDDATGRSVSRVDSALYQTAESICASARSDDFAIWRGTLVTAERVLTRPKEKQALAAKTPALAVDMETAVIARLADERKVPWLAVRVITDGLNDALPFDFNALADKDGNVSRGRVVTAALTHPWKIPALIRLGARSSLAANNLTTFLNALVEAVWFASA